MTNSSELVNYGYFTILYEQLLFKYFQIEIQILDYMKFLTLVLFQIVTFKWLFSSLYSHHRYLEKKVETCFPSIFFGVLVLSL